MYLWLLVAHIIGVLLWISGLAAVYWLLRFHVHAPKEVHEKLTLMERSLALMMDLAATLAIGAGLWMALRHDHTHPTTTLFGAPGAGWFHIKLTVVALGIISMHGMIRARVGKFGRGEIKPVPQWMWSVLLISIVAIVVLVFRGPLLFAPK